MAVDVRIAVGVAKVPIDPNAVAGSGDRSKSNDSFQDMDPITRYRVIMDELYLAPTPADVERTLATRIRAVRRARGWTQAELAKRSGLGLATVARLEQTGQGQISSLTRICAALGRLDDFAALLPEGQPATMDELRRRLRR